MEMFEYLIWFFLVLLLLPVMVLLVQVLSARFLPYQAINVSLNPVSSVILVPAHDEEAVIAKTLSKLLSIVQDNDQILVVADNCSDKTAEIASELGVNVIERHDETQKGKGFALDFGFQYLAKQSQKPDVVVIVDADCVVDAVDIVQLKSRCFELNRPVQALYLMENSATEPSLKQKVAEFAWLVKNFVRPLGSLNLGLPCQLMGTGMAFPWSVINQVNLASGNIVEDMKLGVDLAFAGYAPVFLPQIKVKSYFPETSAAEKSQRTRWEHGHLSMILSQAPKAMMKGIIKANKDLIGLALDLLVPPLALLMMILMMILGLSLIWALYVSSYGPFYFALFLSVTFTASLLMAWSDKGRSIISLQELLLAPFQLLKKLPLYLKFLVKRQKQWVRTDRD